MAAAAGLAAGSAAADQAKGGAYVIEQYSIDAGASYSSAGSYALQATIGQADATPIPPAGGVFSIEGGIWPGNSPPPVADGIHADGFEDG